MMFQLHPPVLRTAAGNREERAAQIQHIQERCDRLRRYTEHMTAEVVAVTREDDHWTLAKTSH